MTDNSRVRVSIVGVVVVALFSALFVRLWFLQVGGGDELKFVAAQNATRVVQTEMPRGRILDRNGVVLVQNRRVWVITISRTIDKPTRAKVLGQLAVVLGVPKKDLQERYDDPRQAVLKPAIVAEDVPEAVQVEILEHQESYPGVQVQKVTVREYPKGALASQVLGYVGEISERQLKSRRDKGYVAGDEIGRAGAERAFEQWLRGTPREETLAVDPRGQQVGEPTDVTDGTVGHDVRLTIDSRVQQLAEQTLAGALPLARERSNHDLEELGDVPYKAPGGSVVVLDASTGELVALASNPSYDPSLFVNGISSADYKALNAPEAQKPLLNRATQGVYAPGSTFKLVSSVAMTSSGVRGAHQWFEDHGDIVFPGSDRVWHNSGSQPHGSIDLTHALTLSSDVYFYSVGDTLWRAWKAGDTERGLTLSTTARAFGFGKKTGIELDEQKGSVPDPKWKHDLSYEINDTEQSKKDNAIWLPGDNINMAVGQGYVGVTPLQLADAYAAFANQGTLYRPHLGFSITAGRKTVHSFAPKKVGAIPFDPDVWNSMNAGFSAVPQDGTAASAFIGFPFDQVPVAGKTGTAQVGTPENQKGDTSLFASYFACPPAASRACTPGHTYVAVAVVEEAGFGAEVAAPIIRRVIEGMTFNADPSPAQVTSGND